MFLYLSILYNNVESDEEFEDTKGVIRMCKSKKNRQQTTQWPNKKGQKGQATIYKTYT